jgi:hypothetical protein
MLARAAQQPGCFSCWDQVCHVHAFILRLKHNKHNEHWPVCVPPPSRMCAPSGQEEFFILVGQPVATRTEPPPPLDADAQAAFIAKSKALAPEYQTELLPPPGAE